MKTVVLVSMDTISL